MERIREVAKQARMIIGEVYGQGVMDTFSADLTSLGGVEGESGWIRKNAQRNYSRIRYVWFHFFFEMFLNIES